MGLLGIIAIPAMVVAFLTVKKWKISIMFLIVLFLCYSVIFDISLPIRAARFLIPVILLLLIMVVFIVEQTFVSDRLKIYIYVLVIFIGSVQIFLITSLSMGTNLLQPLPTSLHLDIDSGKVLLDFAQQIPLWTAIQYLFLLGSVVGLIGWFMEESVKRPKLLFTLASMFTIVALAVGLEQYDRHEYFAYSRSHYADVGQLWRYVNDHTTGQHIAYVGGNIPLPLVGHHLKNVVLPVNVGSGDLLHEIETSIPPDQPIRIYPDNRSDVADQAEWLQNLREKQIDLVVVYDLIPAEWPEVIWMQSSPDQFELLYKGRGGSVWRFRS